jgi:hypothetical protein
LASLVNVTVFANVANDGDGGGGQFGSATPDVVAADSIMWANVAFGGDEGNQETDPVFVDEAALDLHLQAESPHINAGNPNPETGPNDRDLDGRPRVLCGRIDEGASGN